MTLGLYPPPMPGLTFSVLRTPQFNQRVQRSESGRELHSLSTLLPLWEWTLTYEVLRDYHDVRTASPVGTINELRPILNFYTAMQGTFGPFLFFDPTDGQLTSHGIGTGDGTTVLFPLVRELDDSGLLEPIHAAIVNDDAALKSSAGISLATTVVFNVYVNAVLQTPGSDYTEEANPDFPLNAASAVLFTVPPPTGSLITVDMTYLWPVRFKTDSVEFEYFMLGRWGVKQLKLQSYLVPPVFTTLGVSVPHVASVSLSSNSFPAGLLGAVAVGDVTVTMSDGSAFSGTLSVSGPDAADFEFILNTLAAVTSSAGIYDINIVATPTSGVSFTQHETITGTAGQIIQSVSLTNSRFTPSSTSDVNIGTVVVEMNPPTPAFSGTLSLSGPDASRFQLTSATLPSTLQAVAGQTVAGTTYNVNIAANDGAIVNSPIAVIAQLPTLALVITPSSPSIPTTTPLGATVAGLRGVWSDASPFTGGYAFVTPNFDAAGVYAITVNADHTGNLIVNPLGPGVSGSGGTVGDVTIEATQ